MASMARAVCFSIALASAFASLEAQAAITREQAERKALKAAPGGSLLNGGLERAGGRFVWWFDVSIPGSRNVKAIQVDALTGAIVSNTLESPVDR